MWSIWYSFCFAQNRHIMYIHWYVATYGMSQTRNWITTPAPWLDMDKHRTSCINYSALCQNILIHVSLYSFKNILSVPFRCKYFLCTSISIFNSSASRPLLLHSPLTERSRSTAIIMPIFARFLNTVSNNKIKTCTIYNAYLLYVFMLHVSLLAEI